MRLFIAINLNKNMKHALLDVQENITFQPFTITLSGTGCFGDLWWAGIPFDRKSFSPHITLVRNASAHKTPVISIPETSMVVENFSLMRSDFGKNVVVYTEITAIVCRPRYQ